MMDLPKTLPNNDSNITESIVKQFISHLDADEKKQFRAVLDQLAQEYPQISPLQRGVMAVAHTMQMYLMAKYWAITKGEDGAAGLGKEEKELLEWARKTYSDNVSNILQKSVSKGNETTFVDQLDSYLASKKGDAAPEEIESRYQKISLDDIERRENFRARSAPKQDVQTDAPPPVPIRKRDETSDDAGAFVLI